MFASVPRSETSTKSTIVQKFAPRADEPLIATVGGEVPLRQLKVGDMVLTRDNGLQPVRRIATLAALGVGAVAIAKGALGNGMPHRDIVLSARHRVLVTGEIAALLFDATEVLIDARHLTGLAGVSAVSSRVMVHLECDHDEIVLANGCWTEIFAPDARGSGRLHAGRSAELAGAAARDAAVNG